jgi:hypothetical protein
MASIHNCDHGQQFDEFAKLHQSAVNLKMAVARAQAAALELCADDEIVTTIDNLEKLANVLFEQTSPQMPLFP